MSESAFDMVSSLSTKNMSESAFDMVSPLQLKSLPLSSFDTHNNMETEAHSLGQCLGKQFFTSSLFPSQSLPP